MKRPLALFGIGLVAASMVAFCLGVVLRIILAVFFAVAAAALIMLMKNRLLLKRLAVICAAACVGFSLYAAKDIAISKTAARYGGSSSRVVCTVTGCEYQAANFYRITARATQADGEKANFEVVFYSHDSALEYDVMSAQLELEYWGNGVFGAGIAEQAEYLGGSSKLMSFFARLRENISVAVRACVGGDEGGVAAGMLLGDKSGMSYGIYSALVRSGTAHIVVVSGLHITVLVYLIFKLAERLRLPNAVSCAAALVFTVFVVLLVGFTPSVIRAGVTAFIAFSADFFYRKSDGLTSLMAAAVAVLLLDVSAVADASFLLSFSSAFALIVVYPFLSSRAVELLIKKRRLPRIAEQMVRAVLIPFSTTVVGIPILIFLEFPISLVSVAANVAVVWLVPSIIVVCAVMAIFFWTNGGFAAASLLGGAAKLLIRIIISVCSFLSSWSNATLDLSDDVFKLCVVLCAVISVVGYILYRKRFKWIAAAAVCLSLFAVSFAAQSIEKRGSCAVTLVGANRLSVVIDDGEDSLCFYVGSSEYDANLIADYVKLSEIDVALAVGVQQGAAELGYLTDLIDPEYSLSEDDLAERFGKLQTYSQKLSKGSVVLILSEGEYRYMIIESPFADIGVLFDDSLIPPHLLSCDILVATGDAPENIGIYGGTLIASNPIDADGAHEVRYNHTVSIYLFDDKYKVN